MRRRSRRRGDAGGGNRWRYLAVLVVVCVAAVGVHSSAAFSAALVPRASSADVVSDGRGVVALDVASDVHVGTTERLLTTGNNLGRQATVTVAVTGDARGDGTLVVDGADAGNATTYTLAATGSQRVDFRTACDHALAGHSVTVDVRVDGAGVSGTATRAVPIRDASCGATTGAVYAAPSTRALHTVRADGHTGYAATNVQAVGPQTRDLDGDGRVEIPFVNGSAGRVYTVDRANETTVLVDAGGLPGGKSAETSKTELAVGTWNGSDPAVLLVGDGESEVFRVTPAGATRVADPSNGASAVAGVADVDVDGATELVFVDGSSQLRYVDDGGGTVKVANGGVGSNNGVGAGEPADFDGDGMPRVPFVDGSGHLSLVTAGGQKTTLSTTGGSTVSADKAPVGAVDWDGDGVAEAVYLAGGTLHLADDVGNGTASVTTVTRNGTAVAAAGEPGVA